MDLFYEVSSVILALLVKVIILLKFRGHWNLILTVCGFKHNYIVLSNIWLAKIVCCAWGKLLRLLATDLLSYFHEKGKTLKLWDFKRLDLLQSAYSGLDLSTISFSTSWRIMRFCQKSCPSFYGRFRGSKIFCCWRFRNAEDAVTWNENSKMVFCVSVCVRARACACMCACVFYCNCCNFRATSQKLSEKYLKILVCVFFLFPGLFSPQQPEAANTSDGAV